MSPPPDLHLTRSEDETLAVRLVGGWTVGAALPPFASVARELDAEPPPRGVRFDATELAAWDTALVAFVHRLTDRCAERGVPVDPAGLPGRARRLLDLAGTEPERETGRRRAESVVSRVGREAARLGADGVASLTFLGEAALSFGRLLRGRAQMRGSDLFALLQQAGADALPIVGLISVLVGLILGYIGAVQLSLFGVQVYLADLVGIGVIREMGAMMTGIIMAGRTGAAYAAQLGTMQVNEEIDALRTFGIDPVDFLVLPRLLAVTAMLPLLCVYADLMGVLGGAIVGVGSFHLSLVQYLERTRDAVALRHFWVGVFKAAIYGTVVAASGCFRGLRCGRNAAAVGEATTSAVVTAIVWIVIWCAITTVAFQVLGI